jgi:DNA-binding MurR/RpiR family transcriptional regulator
MTWASRDGTGPAGERSQFLRRLQARALSPKHRAVAEYLARNYRTAASQTAAEVGATMRTSEATVIRLARELGYGGFPELRRQLHGMIREDLTSVELLARARPRGRDRDTLGSLAQTEIAHLRALAAETSRDDFRRLVRGLLSARRVYVAGHRASAALAEFFGYTLGKVHEDVVILAAGGVAYDAFRRVPPGAWLVAIAFPRYPRETVEVVEFSRKERITVAAVTDSVLSPIGRQADLVLPVRAEPTSFVDAHCAPQALLAAALVEYGLRARKRTESLLRRFERVVARRGIFHAGD